MLSYYYYLMKGAKIMKKNNKKNKDFKIKQNNIDEKDFLTDKKLSYVYIKSVCTSIARGDIQDIETIARYIKLINPETLIEISDIELDMLFGINLDKLYEEDYLYDFANLKEYTFIDLILFASICKNSNFDSRKKLFCKILELNKSNPLNLKITLNFIVSNGYLELFNILTSSNINFNNKSLLLKNGEYSSILDECLSITICRLTINKQNHSEETYIKIFNYLVSLENIDDELLVVTKIILQIILKTTENDDIIFHNMEDIVLGANKSFLLYN